VDVWQEIEVLRRKQVAPVARVRLPHRCEDVVDWTLNNGVLDITLRLVPVGDLPSTDDEHSDELDDERPPTFEDGTNAIDLSDDEDDEDDDGGIPIL
jgi:hypothetical protein